jgi:hypothetical protein
MPDIVSFRLQTLNTYMFIKLSIGSILTPKDGEAFPDKESIPMLALVIRIHVDG